MRNVPVASVSLGGVLPFVLFGGFLMVTIVSSRNRRRQRGSATAVQLPDGKIVTFQKGKRRRLPASRRVQANALLFVGFAIWAAVVTVHGAPILGPIAAFVLLELALVVFRSSAVAGDVVTDESVAARVAPLLVDVCNRAGCEAPRVVLRTDIGRAAAVRQVRKQTILVLSRTLVNEIDDQALRALIAHEIVHVVTDDLKAARRRALVAALAGTALGVVIAAVAHLPDTVGIPIWFAAGIVGLMAATAGLSPLNRPREERADLEGARLVGDPDAMTRALVRVEALSNETRFRLYGGPPWRWLLAPVSWRLPTHPPIAKRIAALRSMA